MRNLTGNYLRLLHQVDTLIYHQVDVFTFHQVDILRWYMGLTKDNDVLIQASEKIANLTEEKAKLEKEKGKQLRSSIETTIEVKRLVLLEKEWREERKELMAANSELAAELIHVQGQSVCLE